MVIYQPWIIAIMITSKIVIQRLGCLIIRTFLCREVAMIPFIIKAEEISSFSLKRKWNNIHMNNRIVLVNYVCIIEIIIKREGS